MFKADLGKYRTLVISIALFLIFDLGVLVLNFVISSEIAGDALNVNLAGRQRMLSQRIAKTALQVEDRIATGRPFKDEAAELKAAATTFDRTLKAFAGGGATLSGAGTEITIPAIDDEAAQKIIAEAKSLWQPLFGAINTLSAVSSPQAEQAAPLARQAEAANLKLLKLMNDLTTRVEITASEKATTLRMVQVTGITLATINFIVILVHFIGHLRRSDRELERARRETEDILRTTQEGLFLLDPEFKLGTQHSKALKGILGMESFAGKSFIDMLKPMVSEKTLSTAREYLELLVRHDVKEKLVTNLNPLNRVESIVTGASGQPDTRYLEFNFNRVTEEGKVTHLLVTVNDISRRVKLETELAATEARAKGQMSVLVEIMQIEPSALNQFLRAVGEGLQQINKVLSHPDNSQKAQQEKVHALFRLTHRIKGDAAAIGMASLADAFHRVEDQLSAMRERPSLSGENFLPVTVMVKELFDRVALIESAVARVSQVRGITTVEAPRPQHDPTTGQLPFVQQWNGFAKQLAERHGNAAEVTYTGVDLATLPEPVRLAVNTIVNQFIRNSVVHGIESAATRQQLGKSAAGRMSVYVSRREDGGVDLSFRDDGRGISVDRIRQAAVAKGRLTEEEAASWDARRIVSLIFEPGISTAEKEDADAGRGAGLDAVKDLVASMGGHIRIGSSPNEYCHFRISLASHVVTAGAAA
jgi:HPt (histidine-containing phosphotransfer) domain-containing protein/PAS domain-containing protein